MRGQQDEDMERIKDALNLLSEHFDTVQIFATRHEMGSDDGTVSANLGLGNWFARKGQVGEWLLKENERSKLEVHEEE